MSQNGCGSYPYRAFRTARTLTGHVTKPQMHQLLGRRVLVAGEPKMGLFRCQGAEFNRAKEEGKSCLCAESFLIKESFERTALQNPSNKFF